jgi:hypothetical protein
VLLGSFTKRVSRATTVSSLLEDDLEWGAVFGALRPSGLGALRRRPLSGSPNALERLFITFPVG